RHYALLRLNDDYKRNRQHLTDIRSDGHQTAHRQGGRGSPVPAGCRSAVRHPMTETALSLFAGDIDLEKAIRLVSARRACRLRPLRPPPVDRRKQLRAINRVQNSHAAAQIAHLVGLQMSDQMPARAGTHRRGFAEPLLDPVLPEVPQPQLHRRPHGGGINTLTYADQRDRRRITTDPKGGCPDPLAYRCQPIAQLASVQFFHRQSGILLDRFALPAGLNGPDPATPTTTAGAPGLCLRRCLAPAHPSRQTRERSPP
ncbi:MAG: hypothetical protein MZU79_00755, partial [Anaerotruncus sp.]|nr:hypothetical protein [Anaerotruncus sp.]